jgi:hypothetical protein
MLKIKQMITQEINFGVSVYEIIPHMYLKSEILICWDEYF